MELLYINLIPPLDNIRLLPSAPVLSLLTYIDISKGKGNVNVTVNSHVFKKILLIGNISININNCLKANFEPITSNPYPLNNQL